MAGLNRESELRARREEARKKEVRRPEPRVSEREGKDFLDPGFPWRADLFPSRMLEGRKRKIDAPG